MPPKSLERAPPLLLLLELPLLDFLTGVPRVEVPADGASQVSKCSQLSHCCATTITVTTHRA